MTGREILEEATKEKCEEPRNLKIGLMGPIGAGKSTLAQLLADVWSEVEAIGESYPNNPYLEPFYEEPEKYSFKSQVWFLARRMEQLSTLGHNSLKIEDPAQRMNYLFAFVQYEMGWMGQREWQLYESIYMELANAGAIKDPDAFIVVNSPIDVLIDRIRKRGRPYELKMLNENPEYFERLRKAVAGWAKGNKEEFPIIEVNSNDMDFANNHRDAEMVVAHLSDWMSYQFREIGKRVQEVGIITPGFLKNK